MFFKKKKISYGAISQVKIPDKKAALEAEYNGKIYMIKRSIVNAKKSGHPELVPEFQRELREMEKNKSVEMFYKAPKPSRFHIYKKMSAKEIETYVRNYIEKNKNKGEKRVWAEDIAYELDVQVQSIKRVFRMLHREGILSLPMKWDQYQGVRSTNQNVRMENYYNIF